MSTHKCPHAQCKWVATDLHALNQHTIKYHHQRLQDYPTVVVDEIMKAETQPLSDDHRDDPVNHPAHYTSHPSGVECIQITRHMSFNVGNAVKYLWRADLKDAPIQDLEKAAWYIADEIQKRKSKATTQR